MFQSAIEISKSWSSGLNRLGWGSICIYSFGVIYGVINQTNLDTAFVVAANGRSILFLILFLLFSNLLGAMVVSIGSNTLPKKYNIKSNVWRAFRVSETKNELFIQSYQDSMMKFEVACGLRGTFFFLLVILAFGDLTNILPDLPKSADPNLTLYQTGIRIVTILGVLVFGKIVEYTATASLDAIDNALEVAGGAGPAVHAH